MGHLSGTRVSTKSILNYSKLGKSFIMSAGHDHGYKMCYLRLWRRLELLRSVHTIRNYDAYNLFVS